MSVASLMSVISTSRPVGEHPEEQGAVQAALMVFGCVALALQALMPEETTRKRWLATPKSRWKEQSALDLFHAGEAHTVAHVLERVRDGGGGE